MPNIIVRITDKCANYHDGVEDDGGYDNEENYEVGLHVYYRNV